MKSSLITFLKTLPANTKKEVALKKARTKGLIKNPACAAHVTMWYNRTAVQSSPAVTLGKKESIREYPKIPDEFVISYQALGRALRRAKWEEANKAILVLYANCLLKLEALKNK